nr:MAG TPA: hypothetical protein [Caudoviricetes sp.]
MTSQNRKSLKFRYSKIPHLPIMCLQFIGICSIIRLRAVIILLSLRLNGLGDFLITFYYYLFIFFI